MDDRHYSDLYRIALAWTGGDAARARQLTERWFQGRTQEEARAPLTAAEIHGRYGSDRAFDHDRPY